MMAPTSKGAATSLRIARRRSHSRHASRQARPQTGRQACFFSCVLTDRAAWSSSSRSAAPAQRGREERSFERSKFSIFFPSAVRKEKSCEQPATRDRCLQSGTLGFVFKEAPEVAQDLYSKKGTFVFTHQKICSLLWNAAVMPAYRALFLPRNVRPRPHTGWNALSGRSRFLIGSR